MNFAAMSDDELRELLKCGRCYPTAIALHEVLGWPIGGLITEVKNRDWLPYLVHAYVIAPDGRLFDAGGFETRDDIYDFYMTPERLPGCRNTEFRKFGDSAQFREALRLLYNGVSTIPGHQHYDPDFDASLRTEYDDFLDDHVPVIKSVLVLRLNIENNAALSDLRANKAARL